MISICRRLQVIAAEDIGLAYPQGALIVKSLVDSARELGFPEARIPLAEATILLATSPKSNSAINAIDSALKDLDNLSIDDIPPHLKDAHYSGASKLGRGVNINILIFILTIMLNNSIYLIILKTRYIMSMEIIRWKEPLRIIGIKLKENRN